MNSFNETLDAIEKNLTGAAAAVQAFDTMTDSIGPIVSLIPGAAPIVAAIEGIETVAEKVLAGAGGMVDAAQSAIAPLEGPNSATPAAAPAADVVLPSGAPVAPSGVDAAGMAAQNVAEAENMTLEQAMQRIKALEFAILQLLPVIRHVGKQFGF